MNFGPVSAGVQSSAAIEFIVEHQTAGLYTVVVNDDVRYCANLSGDALANFVSDLEFGRYVDADVGNGNSPSLC